MKEHPICETKISTLFQKVKTNHIGTINNDEYPYVLPVHFVYFENKIHRHGLVKGTGSIEISVDICTGKFYK